jgi:hypothetical protein
MFKCVPILRTRSFMLRQFVSWLGEITRKRRSAI